MTALLKALKTLKPWQVSVLVAVLVAAAGGTFGIYALAGSSGGVSLGEDQQLIPVRLGDLVNQVSTNGSLVFPNRETLTFGSQGTVKELLVDEGQQVVEGQVLARLDRSTIASLEKTVVQAQVDLRDAQDELALAKDPHTLLDIAQAEANVANAELSLHNTQEAFDRLLEPTSQDVTQAEAAVSNAKLSLKTAQEALVDLLERTPQETAQAETAVTNARLAVQDAQETLDEVKEGPTSGDLSEARVRVESAITNQANAQGDLKLIRREWNDKEQAAQDVFETALEGYQGVFRKWLGIELSEAETDMDPGALLASWSADLTFLFDPDSQLQDTNTGLASGGPPVDDPGTPWSEVLVYIWLNLFPGQIAPTCEEVVIPLGEVCIKEEMDPPGISTGKHGKTWTRSRPRLRRPSLTPKSELPTPRMP